MLLTGWLGPADQPPPNNLSPSITKTGNPQICNQNPSLLCSSAGLVVPENSWSLGWYNLIIFHNQHHFGTIPGYSFLSIYNFLCVYILFWDMIVNLEWLLLLCCPTHYYYHPGWLVWLLYYCSICKLSSTASLDVFLLANN